MEQNIRKEESNIAKSINKRPNTSKKRKKKGRNAVALIGGILLGMTLGVMITVFVLGDSKSENINETDAENPSISQEQNDVNTLDEILENESYIIKTPFVDLQYPKKWDKKVTVEQIEDKNYTIQFWGTTEGKEAVNLFEIVFGNADGALLGTINETEIYLIHKEIVFDDDWSEEAQNEIYAMQEDVNYIIGMLQKEEGFVPAN